SSSTRITRRSRSACPHAASAPAGRSSSQPVASRASGCCPAPTSPSSRGRLCSSGVAEFRATYRLQLTPDFGFAAARQLVPYLRDLGISHLYLSPSLQARAGSQHGYDVTDPRHISAELGGEEEFRKLATSGLGVILDIVPNHMAAVDESPFWRDERLREMFFDVDLRTGFHRRFFDIGELGGVKQEDQEVFWATHAKVIELARDGTIDGVRVDH